MVCLIVINSLLGAVAPRGGDDFTFYTRNLTEAITNSQIQTPHVKIKILLPTETQKNCFKMSIKIYIKTAQSYSGVITIIRERTV
jgi:hypothetical protein